MHLSVFHERTLNRQLSGAMIRISNCEERDSLANGGSGGSVDRTITMTGNAESVALAQYLINMRYVRLALISRYYHRTHTIPAKYQPTRILYHLIINRLTFLYLSASSC